MIARVSHFMRASYSTVPYMAVERQAITAQLAVCRSAHAVRGSCCCLWTPQLQGSQSQRARSWPWTASILPQTPPCYLLPRAWNCPRAGLAWDCRRCWNSIRQAFMRGDGGGWLSFGQFPAPDIWRSLHMHVCLSRRRPDPVSVSLYVSREDTPPGPRPPPPTRQPPCC